MEDIKEGCIVWLKSGSPRVTVEKVGEFSGALKANCIWFENGNRREELYPLTVLTIEDPEMPALSVW